MTKGDFFVWVRVIYMTWMHIVLDEFLWTQISYERDDLTLKEIKINKIIMPHDRRYMRNQVHMPLGIQCPVSRRLVDCWIKRRLSFSYVLCLAYKCFFVFGKFSFFISHIFLFFLWVLVLILLVSSLLLLCSLFWD